MLAVPKIWKMIVTRNIDLEDFDFWSGAKVNAQKCTIGQLRDIQDVLEDCYPDGIDETALNDLFWFDFDTLKEYTTGLEND